MHAHLTQLLQGLLSNSISQTADQVIGSHAPTYCCWVSLRIVSVVVGESLRIATVVVGWARAPHWWYEQWYCAS